LNFNPSFTLYYTQGHPERSRMDDRHPPPPVGGWRKKGGGFGTGQDTQKPLRLKSERFLLIHCESDLVT